MKTRIFWRTFALSAVGLALASIAIIYFLAKAVEKPLWIYLPATLVLCLVLAFLIALILTRWIISLHTRKISSLLEAIPKQLDGGDLLSAAGLQNDPVDAHLTQQANQVIRTMRQKAELLVREQAKIDYILENLEEGLVLLDDKQNIVAVSKSARYFFQCKEDVIGRGINWLVKDSKITDAVLDASVSGVSRIFDYAASDQRILSLHVTQVNQDFIRRHDYSYGTILIITDVTTERRAQQMRQEFFTNASHELKTPITSVRGFAELLSSDIDFSEKQRAEYFQRIIRESDRMTHLLNDVLTISRLESKEALPPNEWVDLTALAGEIALALHPQAEEKQITITTPEQPLLYYANREQMHQLFGNLMGNAVKYNKENGRVSVAIADREGMVEIIVADTGIGIPIDDQPRIFERFYRVDKGRSKRLGGTGLGLSIVKHIVTRYDGEILLDSQEGNGTHITIRLPKRPELTEMSTK